MKVSELVPPLLDHWVARAEGFTLKGRWWCRADEEWCTGEHFAPSTRWAISGPIIERDLITTVAWEVGQWSAYVGAQGTYLDVKPGWDNECQGPTALIAAMRAFVVSKFGAEVSDAVDSGPRAEFS